MLLWIVLAFITAGALAALLAPLARPARASPARAEHEVVLYRDQLAEIDADLERGQIAPAEAEAARAEIARRLLLSADARGAAPEREGGATLAGWMLAATAAAIAVSVVSLYALLGSPDLPGRSFAERAKDPVDGQSIEVLVAQVEARLRTQPDDGAGWEVIAPVYMRLGRYNDAVGAYERAMALLGETPDRLEGFAEASVVAANGVVGETARKAFAKASEAEPQRLRPRFWLAVAAEQDGRGEEARKAYADLLAEIPAGPGPLRATLIERLTAVGGAPPADTGPTDADMAAAADLSPEERDAMIRGMVEGLAAKLKADGRNLEGWLRLVRSYAVLGEKQKAADALADARKALGDDARAKPELDALARSLGLGS